MFYCVHHLSAAMDGWIDSGRKQVMVVRQHCHKSQCANSCLW